MKKRAFNVNKHFIPKFYLKNFTNQKNKFYAYDLNLKHTYATSPAKESYEKYFYDVNINLFGLFIDGSDNHEEIVDKHIRLLNEKSSAILIDYLNCVEKEEVVFKFPLKKKNDLYNFIIVQLVRTPLYRKKLEYLTEHFCLKANIIEEYDELELNNTIHNLLLYGLLSKLYNTDFKLNSLYFEIFDHILDSLLNIKSQLECSGKFFIVNSSDKEFMCSNKSLNIMWMRDNMHGIKALITPMGDGKLVDIGNQLVFSYLHLPLSSNISIFLFNRNVHEQLIGLSHKICKISNANSGLIDNLNLLTLHISGDKLYSANGNFDDVLLMKENNSIPTYKFT